MLEDSVGVSDFDCKKVTAEIFQTPHLFDASIARLQLWFEQGKTRASTLDISTPLSEHEHEDCLTSRHLLAPRHLLWCAKIFKRGVKQVQAHKQPIFLRPFNENLKESLIPTFCQISSEELLQNVLHDLCGGETLCIVDAGFLKHWPIWKNALESHRSCLFYEPTEHTKNLETIRNWWLWLETIERNSSQPIKTLWSIGGGITTDMAGFLAGLTAIEHKTSPTTLLSASDASVGGKTGVNFAPYGKNQLGLFSPTSCWAVTVSHFSTLNKQEILCGLAETIKHIWLDGNTQNELSLVNKIINNDLAESSTEEFSELVKFNFRIKSTVIALDPWENHLRKSLNLGHTLAHILEGLAEEGFIEHLPHGIAVAIGLQFIIKSNLVKVPLEIEESLALLLVKSGYGTALAWKKDINLEPARAAFFRLACADKKNDKERSESLADMQNFEISFALPRFGHLHDAHVKGLDSIKIDSFVRQIQMSSFIQLLHNVFKDFKLF